MEQCVDSRSTGDMEGVGDGQIACTPLEMRRRGKYAEAISLLKKSLTAHPDNGTLVFELAETYTLQGYIRMAYDLVASWKGDPGIESDKIHMLKAFLEPMVTGKFNDCVAKAEEVHDRYDKIAKTCRDWEQSTSITMYYFKLISLSFIFHHAGYEVKSRVAAQDMLEISDAYLQRGDYESAFPFIVCLLDHGEKRARLEQTVQYAPSNSLCKAKAQAELAELVTGPAKETYRRELRACAFPVLKRLHSHRWLDIQIAEALEAVSNKADVGNNLRIDGFLKAYPSLDFPNGYRGWLYQRLDKAFQIHDYEQQHSLEVEIKSLSRATGTPLFTSLSHVNHIARMYQRSGHDDLVKNTLLMLDEDLKQFDMPFSRGHVGALLTDIYVKCKDTENALKWADRCVLQWDRCPVDTRSLGHLHHLNAKICHQEVSGTADHQSVRQLCDGYVSQDIVCGLHDQASQKLLALIGVYFKLQELSAAEKAYEIEQLLSRAEQAFTAVTEHSRTLWATVLQSKANFYTYLASQSDTLDYEIRTMHALEEALKITAPRPGSTPTYQYLVIQQMAGLAALQICQKLGPEAGELLQSFLSSAHQCFTACIEGFNTISCPSQVGECTYWVALITYESRIRGFVTSEIALQSIAAAEDYFDARRNEISISSGIAAIKSKQSLAKDKHALDIYRFATQVCILDHDGASLWRWVQKAKARSLSDTLALGCLVPESLLDRIRNDEHAQRLFQQEQDVLRSLEQAAMVDKFALTIDLREAQREMETVPLLRSLVDLRSGRALTDSELLDRWKQLAPPEYLENVAFVDWFVKSEAEIYTTILRPGMEIEYRRLNTTTSDVRTWIDQHMRAEQNGGGDFLGRRADHPRQAMRKLDCLVEAIEHCVQPGTFLVLSPSSPLEKVPLHALNVRTWINGTARPGIPLIQRNPLVYCSNFTSFIQSCENAAVRNPDESGPASFIAVYEGTETEAVDATERELIYASTKSISQLDSAVAITGTDVTFDKIREAWQNTGSIFFHGHCDLADGNIIKQSLILCQRSPDGKQQYFKDFTVSDVFDLTMKAPLVNLMACASSVQEIGAADEPLGLVTSFLCAGAASVIGTLWQIRSGTARRFATLFYEMLRSMSQTHAVTPECSAVIHGMVDLAVALQKTVLRLKTEGLTSTPYHWAAFVLHGASFMKKQCTI